MATITADTRFSHPPARVWRALTDPARVSRWLMPATPFELVVGATFSLDAGQWGPIACELVAVEPERRLSYTWRNSALDTVVTYTLEPDGDGTRLHFEHAGFDLNNPQAAFAFQSMGGGWSGHVLPRLVAEVDAE